MATVEERLDRIESLLTSLVNQQPLRDWYSTDQAAEALGKAEFTIREWARLGRIRAQKQRSGRGSHQSWVISRDEIHRYQREGLLPVARPQNN